MRFGLVAILPFCVRVDDISVFDMESEDGCDLDVILPALLGGFSLRFGYEFTPCEVNLSIIHHATPCPPIFIHHN